MSNPLSGLDSRTLGILYELFKRGPRTKKQIQSAMNLKLTTLNRAMHTLMQRDLITSSGETESTGGRRAARYDVMGQKLYLMGVDLSRTYVKIVLTNMKLAVFQTDRFALRERYSAEETIDIILLHMERMLRAGGIAQNQVLGVGVGTVGPLDRERGILLTPQGFPGSGWVNVPLRERVEDRLSIPCFVDNGANAAVLAEYLFGMGKEKGSVAYIHCGIGIRSAVIKDGLVIRTMNDREDAFGNMVIRLQKDGGTVRIESVATLEAIARAAAAELKLGKEKLNAENYQNILQSIPMGNAAVEKIIRESAELFSIGLSNFSRLLNPDVIVLSGPLMTGVENFYRESMEAFYKNCNFSDGVLFSRGGSFQENAIAVGAAAMVMACRCKEKFV